MVSNPNELTINNVEYKCSKRVESSKTSANINNDASKATKSNKASQTRKCLLNIFIRIAHAGGDHPIQLVETRLHAPEAPPAEHGGLDTGGGGSVSSVHRENQK